MLPLQYVINKPPVSTKRATVILTLYLLMWRIWWAPNNASRWQMGFNSAFGGLIKVRSCSALLRVLLVRIRSHLKSFLRHKSLILGTYHPDCIYASKNVKRIRRYFSEPKWVQGQNSWGNTDLRNLWRFSVFLAVPVFVLCALCLVTMSVFLSIYACAIWRTIGLS